VDEHRAVDQHRHDLGTELRAYRRAAGYTQSQLAELIDYSRSTIANVEVGRQHVPRLFWERADTTLHTGGALATAFDEAQAARRRGLQAAARNLTTTRRRRHPQQVPRPLPALQPGMSWTPGSGGPSEQVTLADAAGGTKRPDNDGSGSGPSRPIADGDLARLRSMRRHLKDIDNAHGGGASLPMATWYLRHEVLPLLDDDHSQRLRQSLAEAVAEFQQDVGWMAYDAGQQQLATQHFHAALRLARTAGERLLGARILAAMSHQAIYLGHQRQAIEFAQAARALTRHLATPRTIAMLATMEACSHAAAGDARASHAALADAADAISLIASSEDPEWLDFDEGGYWGHAARAHRDLSELRQAEECAARSIGLCLPGHSRTRAQRTTIQATAYLRMGDLDAAAAAAENVVREAWSLHSGHVFTEVAQLQAALSPAGTPVTKDFLSQARDLLQARAPALTAAGS
jgi:DNA-binding XRE family transcriptional regulator/tetratricopeptide (TPR) repeat protein